eukprot:685632-Pleurochrysis_carterae.AAC.1
MHEFFVRKDRNRIVRILFRQSSQASTWLPEGQGYEVFKTLPSSTPLLAKLKPDSAWKRDMVMATVRRWVPHYTLPREAADARSGVEILNISERMENPYVNPITCPAQRSAVQVAAELKAHQAATRAAAALDPSIPTPIYKGDYLLMHLSAGTDRSALTRHRVVHGIFMQEATRNSCTFTTTEYHPTPAHFNGLWSLFTQRPNTSYERGNVRSGTMYIRHAAVRRDQVAAFNASTFLQEGGKSKELFIHLSSLRELAGMSSAHPLPTTIPSTH